MTARATATASHTMCGHLHSGWRCNRPTGHRGQHMAVIRGKAVAAWWPDHPERNPR